MSGMIPITEPWRHQPPYAVERFDRSNFFGGHCVWACVPGWSRIDGLSGRIWSVGQSMAFDMVGGTGGSGGTTKVQAAHYGEGVGVADAMRVRAASDTSGIFAKRTDNDLGIIFPNPDSLSLYALVYVSGDGEPAGGGDPRFITKDSSWSLADHDIMLGIRGSQNRFRARIRTNGTVETLISNTNNKVQSNALALVSVHMVPFGANSFPVLRSLTEDGVIDRVAGASKAVGYTPRTTTDFAIGCTAGATSQFFDGDIIWLAAFDRHFDADMHDIALMRNPWQIFEPNTVWIPAGLPAASGDIAIATTLALSPAFDMDATGSLAATPALLLSQAADLVASGKLEEAVTLVLTAAYDLSAAGQLSAATSLILALAANLNATGTLALAETIMLTVAADLDASGTLALAVSTTLTFAANITDGATEDIAAAITTALAPAFDLDAQGRLDSANTISVSMTADLKAAGNLQLPASITMSAVADLDAAGQVAAVLPLALSVSTDINAPGELRAAAELVLSASAGITDANAVLTAVRILLSDDNLSIMLDSDESKRPVLDNIVSDFIVSGDDN